MIREAILYGPIYSYSAEAFVRSICDIEANTPDADLVVRLNTNGGDVDYAFGAINRFAQFPGKKKVINDGKAQSMGLYFCAAADYVECHEASNFLLHRPSYPSFVEEDPELFNDQRQASLKDCIKKVRGWLEAKIDVDKFKVVTGHTLDEVFSMDGILDIYLTAQQAKKIGLVDKIEPISAQKKAEIEAKTIAITAKHGGFAIAATTNDNPKTKNKMTLAELKAENPALYNEIFEIGAKQGAEKEGERIAMWNHFAEVDPKLVKEGIESGKPISQVLMLELTERKVAGKKAVKDLEDDSKKEEITTEAVAKTGKEGKDKETAELVKKIAAQSSYLAAK